MASLGHVVFASLSCIALFTYVSGTASENVVNEILQRLKKIEDLNSDLKRENFQLKLEMVDLRDQIDDVRRENRELKQTVNAVNIWMRSGHIPDNERSKTEAKNEMESVPRMPYYQANGGRKENRIRSVKRIIPPAPDVTEQPVAFYAYMDTYSTASLPRHTTLIFDTVQLNNGNGYSKHDGVFIAPRAGVYAFHWSIKIGGYSWASVEIVVNGIPIGCAATESQGVGHWDSGSELVVTRVNTGDHVFLRTQENVIGYLISNHRARTSFSGWLLYF